MRAGAYGLSLLSDPLDVQVLRALEGGELSLIDLRREVGSPPQTTLRKHLKALTHLDLLVRTRQHEFPATVTYALNSSGFGLLAAADAVEGWLATSPNGPLPLGWPAAKSAIKALVDGWTTKMLRALAAKPLSLTELDRLLAGVNYPALERRLTAMRFAGQVEAVPGRAGSTPYRVTRWLREAIGPLLAAANWEGRHNPPNREPLGRLDVEAIFLLAMPLVTLPPSMEGTCRLAVDLSNGGHHTLAGVVVAIEQGKPVSCAADLRAEAASTAAGSSSEWLHALTGENGTGIFYEGDGDVAEALVGALRRVYMRQSANLTVA